MCFLNWVIKIEFSFLLNVSFWIIAKELFAKESMDAPILAENKDIFNNSLLSSETGINKIELNIYLVFRIVLKLS